MTNCRILKLTSACSWTMRGEWLRSAFPWTWVGSCLRRFWCGSQSDPTAHRTAPWSPGRTAWISEVMLWGRAEAHAESSPSRRKAWARGESLSIPRWTSKKRRSRCSQTAESDGRSWTPEAGSGRRKLIPCNEVKMKFRTRANHQTLTLFSPVRKPLQVFQRSEWVPDKGQ